MPVLGGRAATARCRSRALCRMCSVVVRHPVIPPDHVRRLVNVLETLASAINIFGMCSAVPLAPRAMGERVRTRQP